MQIESFGRHAVELVQSCFGIRPETFDVVNVVIADGKYVVRVVDSQMPAITDINQTVVAAPHMRVNHRIQGHLAANNVLQRFLLHIGNNFSKDTAVSIVNSEDDGLAAGTASAFPTL